MAGVGAILKMLEERKQKLAAEGLFDESRKKPLPKLPQTIGVVTSPTGAAFQDIQNRLRERFGLTTADAYKMVDVVFDEICESLINGEEVKFAGFGTFKILEKNARMGRNPKTGASAVISARRVVSFRPSTEFRERVATKK